MFNSQRGRLFTQKSVRLQEAGDGTPTGSAVFLGTQHSCSITVWSVVAGGAKETGGRRASHILCSSVLWNPGIRGDKEKEKNKPGSTLQLWAALSTNDSPGFCLKKTMPTKAHLRPSILPGKSHGRRSLVGCRPWGREESDTTEWLHFHALEKEMATHYSVLAWRIPGTGEPGGLLSMGSHRVGHDWSDLAAAAAFK